MKINPHHVSAYFECPRKAYLLLTSKEKYPMSDYELLVFKAKERAFASYCSKTQPRFYEENNLRDGVSNVINTKIPLGQYQFDCELLLRRDGRSSFGKFYYEPCIFIGTNKVLKENRMELVFLSMLLQQIQGKFPEKAWVVSKKGRRQSFDTKRFKSEMEKAIKDIKAFNEKGPKLILNKHCKFCFFEMKCKEQAERDDSLSLLDRISSKQINKFEKKGIFTIKQLSYLHKPRKRSKRFNLQIDTYKPELQALAIRTKRTYIQKLPTLERKPIEIFLDIESNPDEDFFYLFGILIVEKSDKYFHSFWSDSLIDERKSWQQALLILESLPESPIYHYGSFEFKAFDTLSKRYNMNIDYIQKRLINVNKFIYGKIYFPSYSNGLKNLGEILGVKWRNEKLSGIQSIVCRSYWEDGEVEYKEKLLFYNEDDCTALQILTEELTRIQQNANVSNDLDYIKEQRKVSSERSLFAHDQFKLILISAHNGYNGKKIKINLVQKDKERIQQKKVNKKGSSWWLGKKIFKPNKSLIIPADAFCLKHPTQKLNKSKIKSKRVLVELNFGKNSVKKIMVEYIGIHGYCPLCNNSYAALTFRELSRQLYGHNYKAWVLFQRIEIQLSFAKINQCLSGLINDKIGSSYGVEFVKQFSKLYEITENKIISNILSDPFIHSDETTVSILGENQYVWIFSSERHVIFRLSKSRDSNTAKEFLKGYKGVLISDFYAGYDGIECEQQKCWVHFIRDLNNSLWDNPFDQELENFVCAIRSLLVPIIQDCNIHGLKKYYLTKHKKRVDKFFKKFIDSIFYKSELCILYQKRIKRYRNSLFTFLDYNGISWHNNAAENGIRHICVQRKISGSFGGNQFPHYLRMVSIMQTCKLQNKSFFQFLLSKEMDVDNYGKKKGFNQKRRTDLMLD